MPLSFAVRSYSRNAADPVGKRRTPKLWTCLLWAILPGAFFFGHLPHSVDAIVLALVWFPAYILCEKLGFGDVSVLGPSTIPEWIFFSAIVLISYLYGLVLVVLVRLAVRFGKIIRPKGMAGSLEPGVRIHAPESHAASALIGAARQRAWAYGL